MTDLPPELQQLAALLDAQPGHVQTNFQYCLALLMVEAGKAELVKTEAGEAGPLCTFKTVAGDVFTVSKPAISKEDEVILIKRLRDVLGEEGM